MPSMNSSQANAPAPKAYTFTLPTQDYRALPIPSITGAKVGDCFVPVTALPAELGKFMGVNPRVPNRSKNDILTGNVIKGIIGTMTERPQLMAIKNQGIYLLVHDAEFFHKPGGAGELRVTLSGPDRHGIVNGGHTYAAIMDTREKAEKRGDDLKMEMLHRAFVRLHILQGVDEDNVAEIAEGLNRSKQVDDPSLENLKGHFDQIREIMKGRPGADTIAYHQGEDHDLYITDVLVRLEMFNRERFDRKHHPHNLVRRTKSALQFYQTDLDASPSPLGLLVPRLPQLLELWDMIKQATPEAVERVGFRFGQMKVGKLRAKSPEHLEIPLPFLGKTMEGYVPNGWTYPMFAAFRANVDWDLEKGKFEWRAPLAELVPAVIDELARVCVTEHVENKVPPDLVGWRESTYLACYNEVFIHLSES